MKCIQDTEVIQDEDDEVEQKEKLPRPKNIQVKIGQTIRFQTNENEDTFVCKILSRAGKATGRYKDWFNHVEYTEPEEMAGKQISIDLNSVDNLEYVQNPAVESVQGDEENVMMLENIDDAREH